VFEREVIIIKLFCVVLRNLRHRTTKRDG
jgi:hypothetical protein